MVDTIRLTIGILALLALFNMITTYAFYACLLTFSERVANKTKVKYLEAILN